ncbi:MAG: DUF502 domain-containing protein [Phycisphaeraceae bacterium]
MEPLKRFIKTTTLGGVIVVLPLGILLFVFSWLWGVITSIIAPLTNLVVGDEATSVPRLIVNVLAIAMISVGCFVIGLGVRTAFGRFIQFTLEERILAAIPGYQLIKETVLALFGRGKAPFSSVALCRIFDNDTLVTGFVTDEHEDGGYSVFVPTGPNPTSGGIFHLRPEQVTIVNQPADDVMRSIISCGAGSSKLLAEYRRIQTGDQPEPPAQVPSSRE